MMIKKKQKKLTISKELSNFFSWLDTTEMITDMFNGIDLCDNIAEIAMFEELNVCLAKFCNIVRERIEEHDHKNKIELSEKDYDDIADRRKKLHTEIFGDQLY